MSDTFFGVMCVLVVYLALSHMQLWREVENLRRSIRELRNLENENTLFGCKSRMSILQIVAELSRLVGINVPDLEEALDRERASSKERQH